MEYEKGMTLVKQPAASHSARGRLRPSLAQQRTAASYIFFFFVVGRGPLRRNRPTSMPPIGAGSEQAATWASSRKAAQGALPPGLKIGPGNPDRWIRSDGSAWNSRK